MELEEETPDPIGLALKQPPDEETDMNTIVLANMSVIEGAADDIIARAMQFADNSDGNLEINTAIDSLGAIEETAGEDLILGQNTVVTQEGEVALEDVDYEVETLSDLDNDFDDPDFIIVQYDQEKNGKERVDDDENVNPCSLCNRTFKTPASLKRHIAVCHAQETKQEDPLAFELCYCCEEPLDNAHEVGDLCCDICGKRFTWDTSLVRHVNIEHALDTNSWPCSECDAQFTAQQELAEHLKTHPLQRQISCAQCKRQFTRKYHLERHLMQTGCDGSPKNMFECLVCKKVFTRKDNFRTHLRIHTGQVKDKKLHTCKYCDKEFRGKALLSVHVRTHTGERPYCCDLCPKRFPSSGAMKKHRRMHTGERPYECKLCHKRFSAKETLNRHTRTHTGDRPHECHFCGKSFIQAAQLRAHIFHHTGEHAYICPHCNRAFNRRVRLTMHVQFVHEGAKPLECDQCDRTFFRKEDLARHLLLHSGEKRFECDVCHKKFAVKSSLKLHMLTHRKEKPCGCDECGRAFIRQDCLLRHMRTKHRDVLEDIMAGAEKKRLQQKLLSVTAAAATRVRDNVMESTIWSELTLTDSIRELLGLLVDEETLKSFGWPETPVDKLLDSVIKRCGHRPASEEDFDYIGRMRENAKLLFTVVIDDEAVKSLLNNQTVDEVILHVLKLARSD